MVYFLSSKHYVHVLLHNFRLHTIKHVRTLCASRTSWNFTDGELLVGPSGYRSMVGTLQYLIIMIPDIVYVVNVVSQYIHVCCTTHLHAVKHIFKYLRGA